MSATIVVWVLDPEIALILKATAATAERRGNKVSESLWPTPFQNIGFQRGEGVCPRSYGEFTVIFHH